MKAFPVFLIISCLGSVSFGHWKWFGFTRSKDTGELEWTGFGSSPRERESIPGDELVDRLDNVLENNATLDDSNTEDLMKTNSHNTCKCATRHFLSRIIGGSIVVDKFRYPYHAMLIAGGYSSGATIINRRYLLTAMHCLQTKRGVPHKPKDSLVLVGDSDVLSKESTSRQIFRVKRFIKHKDFNRKTLQNDIAILELGKDIKFNDAVLPACLPTSQEEQYVGQTAIVTGWGATIGYVDKPPQEQIFSDILKETSVTVLNSSNVDCARDSLHDSLTKLCAYKEGTDACQGDSGVLSLCWWMVSTLSLEWSAMERDALSNITLASIQESLISSHGSSTIQRMENV